jgi:hypothetical protein
MSKASSVDRGAAVATWLLWRVYTAGEAHPTRYRRSQMKLLDNLRRAFRRHHALLCCWGG